MVVDAVRTYFDAASGLTELSRKQAVAAAKTLLRAGGTAEAGPVEPGPDGVRPPRVGQSIQALATELIETSQANRAAIADLVAAEVRRAVERLDVVPRSEYERLVRRVAELERRLATRYPVVREPEPPVPPVPAGAEAQAAADGADTPAESAPEPGAQARSAPEPSEERGPAPEEGGAREDAAEEAGPKRAAARTAKPKAKAATRARAGSKSAPKRTATRKSAPKK